VAIEEGAWVGFNSVVDPGVTVPRNSLLDDMSLLDRQWMAEDAVFAGSPAKPSKRAFSPNCVREFIPLELLRFVLRLVLQMYFVVAMLVPSIVLFNYISYWYSPAWAYGSLLILMPLTIPVGALLFVLLKWLLIWRVVPGSYPMYGFFAFRKSLLDSVGYTFFRILVLFWTYQPWLTWMLKLLGASLSANSC
jgi:hypothetical protein